MADAPRQTNVITACNVKFADDEAGLELADSFACVATGAGFTASANMVEVPATGCAPKAQTAAASSWVANLAYLQDWQSPGGGLAGYLYENDALKKWVSVEPTTPGLPAAVALVTIVSGPIFGTFGELLTGTVELAADGKPALTLPVAAAAAADEELDFAAA